MAREARKIGFGSLVGGGVCWQGKECERFHKKACNSIDTAWPCPHRTHSLRQGESD